MRKTSGIKRRFKSGHPHTYSGTDYPKEYGVHTFKFLPLPTVHLHFQAEAFSR